jgi:hypothetical protein
MCHRTQTRIKTKACTALLPTAGAECSNTKREVCMRKVTVWIVLVALFPMVLGGAPPTPKRGPLWEERLGRPWALVSAAPWEGNKGHS